MAPGTLTPTLQSKIDAYFNLLTRLNPSLVHKGQSGLLEMYQSLNIGDGDQLFSEYGVGNLFNPSGIEVIDRPFERIRSYELLLEILHDFNPQQYTVMHKGTPYYFLAWAAFQFREYERAVYYMDLAVSEDLRIEHLPGRGPVTPAMEFFLLPQSHTGPAYMSFYAVREVIMEQLEQFETESGQTFQLATFSEEFIKKLLLHNTLKERSIVTALYSFYLQMDKLKADILIRSSEGGSIEPFINHLFDGARILESLLELHTGVTRPLGHKLDAALADLGIGNVKNGNQSLADAFIKYQDAKQQGRSFQDCNLIASYIIRNTTGHSLLWPDQFVSSQYSQLFRCLSNSILWVIYKCYVPTIPTS